MYIAYFSTHLAFFCFKKGFFGSDDTADPYTCFVGSDVVQGYQGQVTIGVRQMSSVEHDYYITKSHVPPTFPTGSGTFSTNYTIQTVSSTCRFFNETVKDWDTRGCEVEMNKLMQFSF